MRSTCWRSTGKDLRPLLLGERKAKLARLLAGSTAGIVFNENAEDDGAAVFQHACRFPAILLGLKLPGVAPTSGLHE
jgi:hypothetical protein